MAHVVTTSVSNSTHAIMCLECGMRGMGKTDTGISKTSVPHRGAVLPYLGSISFICTAPKGMVFEDFEPFCFETGYRF